MNIQRNVKIEERSGKQVCMFVYNIFNPDIRVLKEANSLTNLGYEVEVYALKDKMTQSYQKYGNVVVHRVERIPFSTRIIELFSTFRFYLVWFATSLIKAIMLSLALVAFHLISNKLDEGLGTTFSGMGLLLLFSLSFSFIIVTATAILRSRWRSHPINRRFKRAIDIKKTLKVILLPFSRYFLYFDYYQKCYKQVKKHKYDFYHAHDLNTLPIAWWCKKRFGGKLVYDSHELYTEISLLTGLDKKIMVLLEKYLIKYCDKIITVCDSIANELKIRYKISLPAVIMNCPEKKEYLNHIKESIREAVKVSDNIPIVLYQGGYSNNRGLRKLIMATEYFESGILVLMGWGKIEDELKELARKNNLSKKIRFIPPVPQTELLQWTSSADLGIIPYRAVGLNNYYSCPNKLFEYINAGIAIAGSAFPEISKIIEGFGLGKTFIPDDPKSIAGAVNEILSNRETLKEMKDNARKAAEIYNWKCESEKFIQVYENLKTEK